MCGITGIVGMASLELVSRMSQTVEHRGPDSHGQWIDQEAGVALGHQRLSIIDLSCQGHQPMANEDRALHITYNGEIYNFQELRRRLEPRHPFHSSTDTEVILHLYEEVGPDVVHHLNGMFAFAIYDSRARTLFLARDHLGIKPLYYLHQEGRFAFASEIKALLATGLCKREINWQAAWDYFTYLYVPHPQTIFQGIHQVPPGCTLQYDLASDRLEVKPYWDPISSPAEGLHLDGHGSPSQAWSEKTRSLLEDAVSHQMVSDVPLGAFLSGGIDSTILVGLMAQHSKNPIQTFTVLFTGDGTDFFNEKEAAQAVAQRWGTEHHELTVDISSPGQMLDLVRCFDQPFGNPTFYLSYLISQMTRQHVKVAVSGGGGDELFAGYPRYRAARYGRFAGRVPVLPQVARGVLGLVPDNFTQPTMRRVKRFLEGLNGDFAQQYTHWVYYLGEPAKRELLRPGHFTDSDSSPRIIRQYLDHAHDRTAALLESPSSGSHPSSLDFMNLVQYTDLKTFLVDNILEYTDRASMAVSLEVRVPFLDYRLVELSQSMPYHYKLHHGSSKAILRDTFRDLIPEENLRAPKKGFCPPLALWMRDVLDEYFDERMSPEYVDREGIFNWDAIQKLRVQHQNGKRDNSMELFGIIMFDIWYQEYILS